MVRHADFAKIDCRACHVTSDQDDLSSHSLWHAAANAMAGGGPAVTAGRFLIKPLDDQILRSHLPIAVKDAWVVREVISLRDNNDHDDLPQERLQ
ncbi:MAG: hypothetical protein AAF745_16805, partial [Planctomycetota bacterium]